MYKHTVSLGAYAVDKEGAIEVDDALSLERLEDGREKIWVHIADVSRWVRPGSKLSLEAERRMATLYLPEEKITMFPESLSSELLSLGASIDSYALSCGVTLDDKGEVTSYEVCPSKIRVTRRLSYPQLDKILHNNATTAFIPYQSPLLPTFDDEEDVVEDDSSDTSDYDGSNYDDNNDDNDVEEIYRKYPAEFRFDSLRIGEDLKRLNELAMLRHSFRTRNGALDHLLRHKTELVLSVKKESQRKGPVTYTVSGHTYWSNGTSLSLVAECMILMCQTIGSWCEKYNAPVWYKIQITDPPLSPADLELRPGETPFVRGARIMKHLRAANDSKIPGPHSTSACNAYVQCTSPIRRYVDLYNHYILKAALHKASLGDEWADRAVEEAGIQLLDRMATAEERLSTLNAIRLVIYFK